MRTRFFFYTPKLSPVPAIAIAAAVGTEVKQETDDCDDETQETQAAKIISGKPIGGHGVPQKGPWQKDDAEDLDEKTVGETNKERTVKDPDEDEEHTRT